MRSTDGGGGAACVTPAGSPAGVCYAVSTGGDELDRVRPGAAPSLRFNRRKGYTTTDNGVTMPPLGAGRVHVPGGRGGGSTWIRFRPTDKHGEVPGPGRIAADSWDQSATDQDIVYIMWRQGRGPNQYGIACSSTGGTSWTPLRSIFFLGPARNPASRRLNSRVYVVYQRRERHQPATCTRPAQTTTIRGPPRERAVGDHGENEQGGVRRDVGAGARPLQQSGKAAWASRWPVDDTNPQHVCMAYAQNTSNTAPIDERRHRVGLRERRP